MPSPNVSVFPYSCCPVVVLRGGGQTFAQGCNRQLSLPAWLICTSLLIHDDMMNA